MEVIYNLSVKKFPLLSLEEQLEVKNQGRPLPHLEIDIHGSSRGKSYKRQFHADIYLRNSWICGCNRKNALFCFPCVLFGGDKSWTLTGVRDLVHLNDKIKKHESSLSHIYNQMELNLFGKNNIATEVKDSAYWVDVQKHNDIVAKNRYMFSKIINCIKFCGGFKLHLRGDNKEFKSSDNSTIFSELINFSTKMDKSLEEYLQNTMGVKDTSKEIQNALLDCMLEVCQEHILDEIQDAEFLAVMFHEIGHTAQRQLVTVFRYVQNGELVERFWNLIPSSEDPQILSETILSTIDPVINELPNKLIAQSYDGGANMNKQYQDVQTIIKEKYPLAYFIHSYAHPINLVLSKAASVNLKVRIFFDKLHAIRAFFNRFPERRIALEETVVREDPFCERPTQWNFNIRTVKVVFEHRNSIIEYMKELQKESDVTTYIESSNIKRTLQDSVFVFWLTFFHYVMPHLDVLFCVLQQKRLDTVKVKHALNVFEGHIKTVYDHIDGIATKASDLVTNTSFDIKRCRLDDLEHTSTAIEVCDIIIQTAKDRFAFTDHLIAASLFDIDRFYDYNCLLFPDEELNSTCVAYPMLHKERLKTELSVIYTRAEVRNLSGVLPLAKFLVDNNLEEAMKETKRLLEIVLTIPMVTVESGRCFSTINRVKKLLRYSMGENGLNSHAMSMIAIEQKLVKSVPNFNQRVIDKLASKKDYGVSLIKK